MFPVHRVMKKSQSGGRDLLCVCVCVCVCVPVTVRETSVFHISRLVSEIPRHMKYQKKADFLVTLVDGVWHNLPS